MQNPRWDHHQWEESQKAKAPLACDGALAYEEALACDEAVSNDEKDTLVINLLTGNHKMYGKQEMNPGR